MTFLMTMYPGGHIELSALPSLKGKVAKKNQEKVSQVGTILPAAHPQRESLWDLLASLRKYSLSHSLRAVASLLCPIRWLAKQSRCADFSHRSSGQWGLSTFEDIRDMISLWFPWGEIPQSPLQILRGYWEPEKATTIPVEYVSQKCGCEIAMCFLGHRSLGLA